MWALCICSAYRFLSKSLVTCLFIWNCISIHYNLTFILAPVYSDSLKGRQGMFRDEIKKKKTSQPGKEYLEEVRKCGGDAHDSECSGEAHISVGVFALLLQKRRSPMESNTTEDLMLSQGMDLSSK